MQRARRLVPLLVSLFASACGSAAVMKAPAPERMRMAGDAAAFPHAIAAVEESGRYIDFALEKTARVFVYSMDRANNLRLMVRCAMTPGTHRVAPTIAAGRIINAFPSGGAALRGWRFRPGEESLLVVLIAEDPGPGPRNNCDLTGDGAVSVVMPVLEAMESLPAQLRLYSASPWTSYLIEL